MTAAMRTLLTVCEEYSNSLLNFNPTYVLLSTAEMNDISALICTQYATCVYFLFVFYISYVYYKYIHLVVFKFINIHSKIINTTDLLFLH